jgi:hypothetical protein
MVFYLLGLVILRAVNKRKIADIIIRVIGAYCPPAERKLASLGSPANAGSVAFPL